jgi:Protein of unknown function (DUF1700)
MSSMDDLVESYLRRLRRELRDVPRSGRDEILEDIEAHIAQAREEAAGEAELRTLLDRLGDPADIAAEARERFGVPVRRRSAVEIAALILLPLGGIVLPFVGWVIGVALLWSSRVWTVRDKVIGTLLVPGGLATALALTLAAGSAQECGGSTELGPGGVPITHTTCGGGGTSAWLIALTVFLWVAPLVSAAYLAWRTSTRAEASPPLGAAVPTR